MSLRERADSLTVSRPLRAIGEVVVEPGALQRHPLGGQGLVQPFQLPLQGTGHGLLLRQLVLRLAVQKGLHCVPVAGQDPVPFTHGEHALVRHLVTDSVGGGGLIDHVGVAEYVLGPGIGGSICIGRGNLCAVAAVVPGGAGPHGGGQGTEDKFGLGSVLLIGAEQAANAFLPGVEGGLIGPIRQSAVERCDGLGLISLGAQGQGLVQIRLGIGFGGEGPGCVIQRGGGSQGANQPEGEQAGAGQQGYHGAEGNDQPVPHAMPSTTRSWVTSVPEPS